MLSDPALRTVPPLWFIESKCAFWRSVRSDLLASEGGGRLSRLNAPYGARCFLTEQGRTAMRKLARISLNAPFGARCFLTGTTRTTVSGTTLVCLNAPSGARCFMATTIITESTREYRCLNVPFCPRFFLTHEKGYEHRPHR